MKSDDPFPPEGPVHLIGIGGTGMSGLASILRGMGIRVTGSDQAALSGSLSRRFARESIPVRMGQAREHLPAGAAAVVASAAVKPDNPERLEALARGVPVLKYAEAVAHLARRRRLVAVAGSHGKTTTTALVAWLLAKAGLSEAFLLGGEVAGLGTNGAWGPGDFFVLEACEYDRSFHRYVPHVAVVTNVDIDHLDYYQTFDAIREAFARFVAAGGPSAITVLCADDPAASALAAEARGTVETVGRTAEARWRLRDTVLAEDGSAFRLTRNGETFGDFRTPLFGLHNVSNAAQAVVTALAVGVPRDRIGELLAGFRGVERRLERLGTVRGSPVLDDYAHHPRELAAAFAAVRQRFPGKRLRVVFQPHQYSRTAYLFDAFVEALSGADDLLLAPVYGARSDLPAAPAGEAQAGPSVPSADSADLAHALSRLAPCMPPRDASRRGQVRCFTTFAEIVEALREDVSASDVILIAGAGDVTRIGRELVRDHGVPDREET